MCANLYLVRFLNCCWRRQKDKGRRVKVKRPQKERVQVDSSFPDGREVCGYIENDSFGIN